MKINAYIMANRTQEVPIPIPGEEVTENISWEYGLPTLYGMIENGSWQQGRGYFTDHISYPVVTSSGYPGSITNDGYENEGWIPTNRDWETGLYADEGWGIYVRSIIQNVKGTVTLNFTGLPAGKYVAVFEHFYGSRDVSRWSTTPPVDSNLVAAENIQKTKTIGMSTHGIVYGEYNGDYVFDQSTQGYSIGNGRMCKFTQRIAFTIAEGETSKVFKYGEDGFALSDFCEVVERFFSSDGTPSVGGRYNTKKTGIRTRLYKEA